MKKMVWVLLVLVATNLHAQEFQGSISWTVQYNVTDTVHKNDGMNLVFPKGFSMQFAKNNYLMKTDGGMLPIELLWLGDKKQYYQINPDAKTYTLLPADTGARALPEKYRPVVSKTNETMVIQGYTCAKYIIKFADTSVHQFYWTTTAIKVPSMKTLPGQSRQSMSYEGMNGLPLKMELFSAQMHMVSEVTAVSTTPLPDTLFNLPPTYTQVKLQ